MGENVGCQSVVQSVITVFCGSDISLRNIPRIHTEFGNIPHNNVSPA